MTKSVSPTCVLLNEYSLDIGTALQCLVDGGLERDAPAATQPFVGRDDHIGVTCDGVVIICNQSNDIYPQFRMRILSASALNPANTTLCGAPIRAQASMAYTACGVIGMYKHTRSP